MSAFDYLFPSIPFPSVLFNQQVTQVIIGSGGEEQPPPSGKISAEECQKVLGFNKAALLCSSCDDLSKFKVEIHGLVKSVKFSQITACLSSRLARLWSLIAQGVAPTTDANLRPRSTPKLFSKCVDDDWVRSSNGAHNGNV